MFLNVYVLFGLNQDTHARILQQYLFNQLLTTLAESQQQVVLTRLYNEPKHTITLWNHLTRYRYQIIVQSSSCYIRGLYGPRRIYNSVHIRRTNHFAVCGRSTSTRYNACS